MDRFFVDPDISKAETIAKEVYLDNGILELSKERIFAKSWQFIGDVSILPEELNIYPFTFLEEFCNEPLVLTRNREGVLHCLSNVCTHRGNLVADKACSSPHLQCRYHGRRFSLDGRFSFMPEFTGVQNFPSEKDHLTSLPLHRWGKWLFTSLESTDPAPFFGAMAERLSWLPLDRFVFRPDLSRDYYVEAHWALYCENYLEGFHIPFVHAGLNAVIDYGSYTTELFPYANLQLGLAKKGELAFDLPASSPDLGKRVGAYYFWVFPNLMFNFYPWGVSINVVKPLDIRNTMVSFLTYVWDESKMEQGAGSDLFTVEMEDEEVVCAVQKGIRSRFYSRGRYSATREQGVHHFHQLLAAHLNAS